MATLKNHPGFELRDDAAAAFDAYEDAFGIRQVNSARRSVASQNELIRRWHIGGKYNRPPYLYRPAEPAETSRHVAEGGIAVDIGDWRTFKEHAEEFGFHWWGEGDVVHFEFRGWSGGGSGARGGYADGSAELRVFQQKLISMGHDLGSSGADGILGPKTKAATRFEQGKAAPNGYPGGALKQDGIPGPATNGYLDWWITGRHQSVPKSGPLSYADIQRGLNRFGYGLAVDGVWGRRSSNALADFQRRHGLTPDRIVGPKTRAALGI